METMLADANKDLAAAQRQVLQLREQVERGGGGAPAISDDSKTSKELEKLKRSVSNTNKELSEAQYSILAQREQFKELQEMLEDLEPLLDMKNKKVKALVEQMNDKLDEALEEDDEEP